MEKYIVFIRSFNPNKKSTYGEIRDAVGNLVKEGILAKIITEGEVFSPMDMIQHLKADRSLSDKLSKMDLPRPYILIAAQLSSNREISEEEISQKLKGHNLQISAYQR